MSRAILLAFALAALPLPAAAERAYVTDKLTLGLRSGPAANAPVVATVTSGMELQVLERGGGQARVRDARGLEGWIDAQLLVPEPPAPIQWDRLKAELAQAKAERLETQLAVASVPENSAPAPNPPAPAAPFDYGWPALSFAMLMVGFAAGVVWLRERNRKKLGGRYLRI